MRIHCAFMGQTNIPAIIHYREAWKRAIRA